ncbi:MAG TPA: WecB/TagA/CpsF family glycosyltransferase [Verrucomicrobiae bacterium]|nr:WecB/TagA/CpsF family glycosyltransferase [Verrucomicrobiae bacterium]
MKVDIAEILVDRITRQETINRISEYVRSGKRGYAVTVYSEFIVFAQSDPEYKQVLNNAALSLPDGVGIIWAAKYLSLKASNKIQALWQIVYTGASLIFAPSYCRTILPEQVIGSRIIWDIAEMCQKQNFSMALVGGEQNVSQVTAEKLKTVCPSLKINLAISNNVPFDQALVQKIASSNSDILLIAYQPPKQEKWLAANINALNVKMAMGVGGTFDYISGHRLNVPKLVSQLGLEWFWRLITQPWRVKRIWNAIIVFISIVYRYKLKQQNLV